MKKTYAPLGRIISTLESAYAAAWRAMSIAKKLKNAIKRKANRSRIMSRINKIRAELVRYSRLNWSLFDVTTYSGVVFTLVDRGAIIHSRFLRGVNV